jgi:hypothetical protein
MRLALSDLVGTGCVVLLGIWLLLTICNQFNLRWMRLIRRFDLMMLIPRWSFFAPNPGLSDFHLSVRTFDADGVASPWEEIDGIAQRALRSALWNPDKRVTKAVIEVASVLMPLCRDHPERVAGSASYQCLMNHAIRAAARAGAARVPTRCEFRLSETLPAHSVSHEPFVYCSAPVRLRVDHANQ